MRLLLAVFCAAFVSFAYGQKTNEYSVYEIVRETKFFEAPDAAAGLVRENVYSGEEVVIKDISGIWATALIGIKHDFTVFVRAADIQKTDKTRKIVDNGKEKRRLGMLTMTYDEISNSTSYSTGWFNIGVLDLNAFHIISGKFREGTPTSIVLMFGTRGGEYRRLISMRTVTMQWFSKTKSYSGEHAFAGAGMDEVLSINVPNTHFLDLVTAGNLAVKVGNDTVKFSEANMAPLRALAKMIKTK